MVNYFAVRVTGDSGDSFVMSGPLSKFAGLGRAPQLTDDRGIAEDILAEYESVMTRKYGLDQYSHGEIITVVI